MFEDIAKPPKGKGKEKDVGKRRAYVRVVTNLGGASLNLELFCEKVMFVFDHHSTTVNLLFEGTQDMLQLLDVGEGREIQ